MGFHPDTLVLHHSAGGGTLEQLAAKRFYHIVVEDREKDAGGPRLLVSVPADQKSEFATGAYNSRAAAVCVLGNFEHQRPTELLLPYLIQVFARRARYYGIRASRIYSHGYVGKYLVAPNNRYVTACCGHHLELLLPDIRAGVARYL